MAQVRSVRALVMCLGGILLVALRPARAEDAEICITASGDTRIIACTRALESAELNATNRAAVFFHRGLAFYLRAEYNRAIQDYDEAIRLKPDDPGVFKGRGNAYFAQREYDRAIQDYDEAIQLRADYIDAYYNRGNAYFASRVYDYAIRDYDNAIRLNPDFAEAFNNRGNAYSATGEYRLAIQDFDQAIQLNSGFALAHNNRGFAYELIGELEQAGGDYRRALEADPNLSLAKSNLKNLGAARVRRAQERLASLGFDIGPVDGVAGERTVRAVKVFQSNQGLPVDGEIDETLVSRLDRVVADGHQHEILTAKTKLCRTGSGASAIAACSRVLGSEGLAVSERADILVHRGHLLAEEGKYERAIRDDEEAIQLKPDHVKAYNNRGYAYEQLGDLALARRDYVKALELSPDYAVAKRNLARLEIEMAAGSSGRAARSIGPPSQAGVTQEPIRLPGPSADTEPPVIETLLRVETSERVARIEGRVRDPGGIDRLTVAGAEWPVDADGTFRHEAYAPLGESTLEIAAVDRAGNAASATVIVVRRPAAPTTPAVTQLDPLAVTGVTREDAFALIIGVETYARIPPARFAADDAKLFYDYAATTLGVPEQNIVLLTNADATLYNVLDALDLRLKSRLVPGESEVFIFFSGHGLASEDGQHAYLLPQDAHPERLVHSSVDRDALVQDLLAAGAAKITLFIDSCYGGRTRAGEALLASAKGLRVVLGENRLPANVTMLAAASGQQIATALESAGKGLFSYFLMLGLQGQADADRDHTITAGEMRDYLQGQVRKHAPTEQTPELAGDPGAVLARW